MEITLGAGAEPVPGYRLVERLGRGGCGEVWKAIGPGGFELALKFVCLAEPVGQPELRAIQIIKDVRHPHLLATFGAWQVGSYLIIARELAERTLLDRFRETAGQGFPGIPAPEIHEHFLDAARGLDYLNEPRHPSGGAEPVGIQHRDVKPQNLLLVGGSVKVADFGLARILEHTQTSHTGSMTPAYAAPEFFKKQTSSQSDQYSLAVTYCHLRGGRPPFTGGMAEIMAGHLLEPPDLTMLPEGEREAAARALAKVPRDRWGSCRAFVEALRSEVPAPDRVAPTAGPVGPPACGTFRPGEAGGASSTAGPGSSASPGRPAPVSPPDHWGARPEVPSRRSPTAMSDRGRKVLARSLMALSSSLVLVLGLWALGMFAPVGRPREAPGPTPIAPPSDIRPGGPVTSAPPEPPPPSRAVAAEPGRYTEEQIAKLWGIPPSGAVAAGPGPPSAPKRAPTLSLDVEKSKRGVAETKPAETKAALLAAEETKAGAAYRLTVPAGGKAEPRPAEETKAEPRPAEKTKAEPRPAEKTKETTVVDSAVSYWTKGKALLDDHKGDEAIVEFDEAVRLDPKYAQAYIDRGLAYSRKGDPDRALADYNEALRLDPKLALAYAGRGHAYARKGDLVRAFADCEEALRLDPKLALAYNSRGLAYARKGDPDRAIADYNEALRLDPKLAMAYDNRGLAYSRKGDPDRAIADYNEALRLDPKLALAYARRGHAYARKGDLVRAFADCEEALRLDPKLAMAYNSRGHAYARKGDLDRAIADYNEALRLDPKLAMAYDNRGLAYSRKGDPDRAIADYDEAIRLDPKYAMAYNNRGLAYARKGDPDRAIADYDAAIRLDPKLAMAYLNRGFAYDKKGDLDRAIADYDAALRLDPKLTLASARRNAAYEKKQRIRTRLGSQKGHSGT